MDEAPNNYVNIIDEQDLFLSTIPWANEFDFGEEAELTKLFDMTQEDYMNTTIISELPNVVPEEQQPMTTTNIFSNSSTDKNFSRIAYPITIDDYDDYSLSDIYSMGSKNVSMLKEDGGTSTNAINQENPKTFIPMPIVMEKQGETTNDTILQQPLPKIPTLEKFEREASLKSKFISDKPLRTSTDSWKEEENHKTNDMSHILTLEKLESHFI
ncbi:hypothetical protein KY290_001488 [Solanum tuberosum]|uniref:Uncharacterized protein n=1 Tax=Solanum tuberosum TaxID=4113 RepID=A0ABQ7WPL4_SOLTU|nr:hypothetical protein KY290_001488 [Solanum tuberosum]